MPERKFSDRVRELAVQVAEDFGDAETARVLHVSESTIRTWRRRAKMVDHRAARDEDTSTSAAEMVDAMIPDGGWNSAGGCESKISARARVVRDFKLGGELLSTAPNRDLGVPASEAAGLRGGDILCLGEPHLAGFSDRLWEIVERAGRWRDRYQYRPSLPRDLNPTTGLFDMGPTAEDPDPLADYALLIVRPARVRPDTQLSDDRERLEPRPPVDYERHRRRQAQRLKNLEAQPPIHPPQAA